MRYFYTLIFGFTFCFFVSAQESWKVDNAHSNIRFEVGWQDFSVRTGEFKVFDGELIANSIDDLSNASFSLTVDPKSIDVISDRLSEQLKGERFLDTLKFPEISFNSSGAQAISDSSYITNGLLNIHGVAREQDVFIRFRGHKKERRNYLLGLEVTLELNKNDFGLTWGSPRLGEKVKVIGHLLYQMRIEEQ